MIDKQIIDYIQTLLIKAIYSIPLYSAIFVNASQSQAFTNLDTNCMNILPFLSICGIISKMSFILQF